MQKMCLFIIALFISVHCFADTTSTNLRSTIINGFNQHESAKQDLFSIVYGGHDFSDANVAIANKSVLLGQANTIS